MQLHLCSWFISICILLSVAVKQIFSPKLGLHGTVQYVVKNTTCRSVFLSVTLNTELEPGCGSYSKTESSRKRSKTCFPKHLQSSLVNVLMFNLHTNFLVTILLIWYQNLVTSLWGQDVFPKLLNCVLDTYFLSKSHDFLRLKRTKNKLFLPNQ